MKGYTNGTDFEPHYSLLCGASDALTALNKTTTSQLPEELKVILQQVTFHTASDVNNDGLYFPCPFKEIEATAALKAVEASAVAAIADFRYGKRDRKITVNLESTAAFLFSTYIATIGGLRKGDPKVKAKLKGEFCSDYHILSSTPLTRICV